MKRGCLGGLRKGEPVTVYGAGAAGLFAAYALMRRGIPVEVHEESDRVGGLIKTQQQNGFQWEWASNSLVGSPELRVLVEEVKCPMSHLQRHQKYILRDGKLCRLPLRFREIARMLWSRRSTADQVSSFVTEKYGQAALDYLFDPMVTGIYAARPEDLSVAAAFPHWKKQARPPPRRRQILAPTLGLEHLMTCIAERLGERVKLRRPLRDLPTHNAVITIPAHRLKDWVPAATRVRYAPLISCAVMLEYDKRLPRGLGVLVPRVEKAKILGVLFSSSAFSGRAQNTETLWTVLMGGLRHPEHIERSDEELRSCIEQDLQLISPWVKIKGLQIKRWEHALPIYDRSLIDVWQELDRYSHTVFFGNYTGEISLRGMLSAAFNDLPNLYLQSNG